MKEVPLSEVKDDLFRFLREAGTQAAGYVALVEINDDETVTILAVRHQREDDYH